MRNLNLRIKKKALTLLSVLFCLIATGQTPPSGLNGEALKTWLKQNYYDGKHSQLGYTSARRYMYNYIDNENNKITGVYSGYQVNWTYGGTGTNPAPINCEHTIPQSFFSEAEPMKSDIHHLFPTYQNWNSTRSNYPLKDIDDNATTKWMYLDRSQTSIPVSNIDSYSEYASSTFEPREDHKGNCARAIFYFYTMYPTQAGDISRVGDINVFYQWHLNDPVDAQEIERNNEIETYQGNKNPYISMPELVARAWGFSSGNPVPAAPVISIATSTSSITLSWADVANETGYSLYRSTNGTSFSLLSQPGQNSVSYTDNSVVENTTYYYYLVAYNSAGNSSQSNQVSGQLEQGITVPVAPVISIATSTSNITLSWADVANETGYSLYRSTNGTSFSLLSQPGQNSASYTDNAVVENTTYYYYLVAYNSAGNSSQSNQVSGQLEQGITLPVAPVISIATSTSNITLSWTDVANETGYSLYRSTNGTSFSLLSQPGQNSVSYTDNAVVENTTYYYYLIAYNSAGNSPQSNQVSGQLEQSNGGEIDLLFSEYIEGSSYNKALEIANITGAAVNLSGYSIMKQTNGAGSWDSELALSGSISNGDVYVVANSSASQAILSVADLTTGSGALTFNGNDAVGLFKNGILIDIIGVFNNGADFAKDVTLVRKSSVSTPNTTYTSEEWEVLTIDDFSNLGSHINIGGAIDLLFSEYIEGSSYNKALEIANNTGAAVSLSGYSIMKQTNGAGSWDSELALSGSINNDDVYVVANSSASQAILSVADLSTGSGALTFNGNDAVGLFKNGILIDIIGVFNSSADFAKDVTLVRNSSVTSPNTVYTVGEWEVFATDDFSNLGTHNNGGSGTTVPQITELINTDFESGWGVWREGGDDCSLYTYSTYATQGSNAANIQDNSGTYSSFYLNNSIDIHTDEYTQLDVTFNFIPVSMELGENFFVEFYNGFNWLIVADFVSGTDFDNNKVYAATVTISETDYDFPTNMNLRFRCDASANKDDVYIDEIVVNASTGLKGTSGSQIIPFDKVVPELEEIEGLTAGIYPNPASDYIYVDINAENSVDTKSNIAIYNLQGKEMLRQIEHHDEENIQVRLDVTSLESGLYFVKVINGEQIFAQRLLVK